MPGHEDPARPSTELKLVVELLMRGRVLKEEFNSDLDSESDNPAVGSECGIRSMA
jgi:hypothetical protein